MDLIEKEVFPFGWSYLSGIVSLPYLLPVKNSNFNVDCV